MAKNLITADDVIKAGACVSGVYEVLVREHKHIRAAMPTHSVLRVLGEEEKQYVAQLNGYGHYGYGYGYGHYGYE